uniref:programmed cell death 1 ligand 1-like n=1 Tax=Monopterus albus TaxID=43700 RepID=UPI0009B2F425|nr:programmed cell death 1 ligand 1-like [Monopterus albus]
MITLLCQAPSNMTILGVRWTRPDLNPKHVLSLQDGQLDLINQHPSFRNRVELVSRQLTNGDLSLVLKDVRAGDRGTYECRYRGRRGAVSVESEPVSLINLTASQSDDATSRQARGHTAVIVTLSVIGVVALLAAVVAVVISRKCRRHSPQQN